MRQSIPRWGLFVIVALLALGLSSATQADGPVNQENAQSDGSSNGGGSVPFADVPSGHWAADDVSFLVNQGVIEGVPGGQFQGERAPSRYEVATMLSRALQGLEGMEVRQSQTPSTAASSESQIRPEDLQVLQDLIFKISDRVQGLSSEVDTLKSENPQIDPQLRERIQRVEGQSEQISQLQTTVQEQRQQINQLQQRMESFQVNATTASEEQLAEADQQILANRIIGITGLLFSVVGIALTTLR